MLSYLTHKDMPYGLRKGPTLGLLKLMHFTTVRLQFIFCYGDSLFEFKNKIKNIGDIDCGCLICRDM